MGKRFIISSESVAAVKQHTAPCSDCPWSRRSYPGWIGPNSVQEWVSCAHSDERINCHTRTNKRGEPWQCAGAAIYRTHICKSPRDPEILELPANKALVFSWGEFEKHHAISNAPSTRHSNEDKS